MKKAWPKVRLGEVLKRSTETVNLIPDNEYSEITVRLWGKGVVERGRVLGAEIAAGRRFIARAGQFIASRIDARNGAMGIVPESLEGAIVTNDFPLLNLNLERLLPSYLGWLCRTKYFWDLCQRASEGTTNRVRLQEDRFLQFEILLPSVAVQKRIVSRIDELVTETEVARKLRQTATEEVTILLQRNAECIFDKLAKTTPTCSLDKVVSLRGGGTPSKVDPFYWDGNIPWITPKDMKMRELIDAIDHISERATKSTAAKLISPGAVLVVVRGMILSHTFPTAVLRVPAAINQDMKALVPNSRLLPEFLCAQFWAYNSRILKLVDKSTHDTRKLETAKLLDTKIVVPQLPEQRRTVAELDVLSAEVERLKLLQIESDSDLDTLLPAILNSASNNDL